jgi:hypothetical protein
MERRKDANGVLGRIRHIGVGILEMTQRWWLSVLSSGLMIPIAPIVALRVTPIVALRVTPIIVMVATVIAMVVIVTVI